MLSFSEIQKFRKKLTAFLTGEVERCGIITAQGEIVECQNLAEDPRDAFRFREEDLKGAIATWHTHPSTTGNLSVKDYIFFKSWPNYTHFTISSDGVWCYIMDEQLRVIQVDEEDDYPARPFGREVS